MTELKELFNLYEESKNNYSSDNNNLIEFDTKEFEEYEVDIAYNNLDDEYYIFIIIEKEKKLKFKGLFKQDKNRIDNIYFELKEDLYSLKFEEFIKKYYLTLKNNF